MDRLTKVVYRSTLRTALKLDTRPALQALIHRDVNRELPEDFSSILSVFLGGPHRSFYMPSMLPGPTVAQTIRDAFRFPPGPPNIDSGLLGMRFLTSILQAAEKHGLFPEVQPSSVMRKEAREPPQVRLQAMPEQACLLVSHPLLYHPSFNFFYQTVVLLCRHSLTSGAYGLALNKLMSTEAKAIMSDIMVSNSPASHGQQQSRMQPEANLDLSKDLPAATQGFPESPRQHGSGGANIAGLQDLEIQESQSDDDLQFEAQTSDTDADTDDISFSTSEASMDRFIPVSSCGDPQSADHPQETDQDDPSEAGDADTSDEARQESVPWQAKIRPSPPVRGRLQSWQSRQSTPEASGDIADPQHPSKSNPVVSSLRRLEPHVDPISGPQQADPPSLQSQSSTPDEQAQHLSAAPDILQSSSSQDQAQPASSSSEPLGTASLDDAYQQIDRNISEIYELMDEVKRDFRALVPSHDWRKVPGTSRGSSIGQPTDAGHPNLLPMLSGPQQKMTMSRGGPVTGGQTLHGQPDLGGDIVVPPVASHQGLYLGTDIRRVKELEAAGRLVPSDLRVFIGEANWMSGQLEQELARGSWLLLSAEPGLLYNLALLPHQFGNDTRHSGDITDDTARASVRQGMWQHVLGKAGNSFADLSNISKELAKELQHLTY
ncbi:hypothetical protein WJX79_005011 [Trebouxia sp. C0005]